MATFIKLHFKKDGEVFINVDNIVAFHNNKEFINGKLFDEYRIIKTVDGHMYQVKETVDEIKNLLSRAK